MNLITPGLYRPRIIPQIVVATAARILAVSDSPLADRLEKIAQMRDLQNIGLRASNTLHFMLATAFFLDTLEAHSPVILPVKLDHDEVRNGSHRRAFEFSPRMLFASLSALCWQFSQGSPRRLGDLLSMCNEHIRSFSLVLRD